MNNLTLKLNKKTIDILLKESNCFKAMPNNKNNLIPFNIYLTTEEGFSIHLIDKNSTMIDSTYESTRKTIF